MRTRMLGGAMIMFGIAGTLLSYGIWWWLYRFGQSAADAADIDVACTQFCDGIGGPALIGLAASGATAALGLCVVIVSLIATGRREQP